MLSPLRQTAPSVAAIAGYADTSNHKRPAPCARVSAIRRAGRHCISWLNT